MNLEFTPEEQAFRDEVRAFIAENYPKHLGDVGLREDLSREDFLAWHKILHKKGWIAPAWPVEYGGQGLGHIEKITFEAEEMKHGFPNVYFGISLGMPVPVLMQFGSDREFVKERVVKALKGEEIWC